MLRTNSQVCAILEKTKQVVLELFEGTANVLVTATGLEPTTT